MNDNSINNQLSLSKLFVPSLFLSNYAAQSGGIITSLLLIDIGKTFNCPVGVAGQLRTISSGTGVVFSILMGVFSLRYNHKKLLMTGLLLLTLSSIGCYLSPSFNLMMASYTLAGIGIAVYGPMSTTLIGELLPIEKRAGAIGWIVAGMSISYLIGALAIGYIAGIGGWRGSFLLYALPIVILSFMLVTIAIPSQQRDERKASYSYLDGFKAVFTNMSANACLFCYILSSAAWQFGLLYGMSFVRQRFHLSTSSASIFMVGASIAFTIGSIVSGRLVNKYGRKSLTVISIFLMSALTIIGPFLFDFIIYAILTLFSCIFSGMMFTGIRSLTLEQVSSFRGTIMSLNNASMQMGYTLGAGIGGLTLLLFDYQGTGLALGGMGLVGALFLYIFAIDPLRT